MTIKVFDWNIPVTSGRKFWSTDGALTSGHLMLFDYSREAYVSATNLAVEPLAALVSGGTITENRTGALNVTASGGVYKDSADAATDRSSLVISTEVEDYIYNSGAGRDNLVYIMWMRGATGETGFIADVNQNIDRYIQTSGAALGLWRLEVNNGQMKIQSNYGISNGVFSAANDNLQQIAVSRDHLMVNGQIVMDQPAINVAFYHDFVTQLNTLSVTSYFFSGTVTGDSVTVYRRALVDAEAAGLTPLEAVRRDFDSVMRSASFVATR